MGRKGQAGEGAARKEEKRSFMDGVKEETKSVKQKEKGKEETEEEEEAKRCGKKNYRHGRKM